MRYLLVIISVIMLSACEGVEKLDKQLYDSTESTVPITKIDQLEQIDKLEKEGATTPAKDTTKHE